MEDSSVVNLYKLKKESGRVEGEGEGEGEGEKGPTS